MSSNREDNAVDILYDSDGILIGLVAAFHGAYKLPEMVPEWHFSYISIILSIAQMEALNLQILKIKWKHLPLYNTFFVFGTKVCTNRYSWRKQIRDI